jgi:L-amino acid N-acyltransferase YncA
MSVTLRVASPSDARDIQAIYTPIVTGTAISFETEAPTSDEMARRITSTLATHPWLVAGEGGRVLGYAYAARHRERRAYRWSTDVSVYVHPDGRGRGIGAGLYVSLLALLARQGLRRAYAGITLPNAASVALHEAAGFVRVGVYRNVGFKLGAWHDVGWWERPLSAATDAPPEPLSFAQIAGDPAVAEALAAGARRVAA